jgi:ElaB/YqjD/DUF883 family membrane-anchored ribosome-binding protein
LNQQWFSSIKFGSFICIQIDNLLRREVMDTKVIDSKNTNISVSKEKLMKDLRMVVADAEELLRATANQAGEGAAVARARIQENLQVVKGRMVDAEDAVIERTRQAAKDTDQYVHDNPWQAIGVSACVGAIVGMLISRR